MHTLNRFIRLARVFIEGRGIPFLGSGVSLDAKYPTSRSWKPEVRNMVSLVLEKVCENLLDSKQDCLDDFAAAFKITKDTVRKKFPDDEVDESDLNWLASWAKKNPRNFKEILAGSVGNKLDVLCQAALTTGVLNQNEIVETLHIQEYADLLPTPAHYYIAFLVRENLVNEIITTNYDCCQERAVNHCKGTDRNNRSSTHGNSGLALDTPAVSIFDLQTYRIHGARRFDAIQNTTILRCYKINGCAGELQNSIDHADKILLASGQLEEMRDRKWAHDLIKDRIRSRALIFSGFGSDEPQIQFTINRLMDEFNLDNSNESGTKEKNAIWIHSYSSTLNLTQQRILGKFWPNDKYEEHCLSGNDYDDIKRYQGQPEKNATCLTADLFWQTLFQVIFLALLERYTYPDAPGWQLLSQIDVPSRTVARRKDLMRWFDPAGIGKSVLDTLVLTETADNPLQRIDMLLGFYETKPDRSWMPRVGIGLCIWLRAMRCRSMPTGDDSLPETYYLALARSPGPVLFLLCLWWLAGDESGNPPFEVLFSQPRLYLVLGDMRLRILEAYNGQRLLRDHNNDQQVTIPVSYLSSPTTISATLPGEEFMVIDETCSDDSLAIRRIRPLHSRVILRCLGMHQREGERPEDYNHRRYLAMLVEEARTDSCRPLHRAIIEPVPQKS